MPRLTPKVQRKDGSVLLAAMCATVFVSNAVASVAEPGWDWAQALTAVVFAAALINELRLMLRWNVGLILAAHIERRSGVSTEGEPNA